MKVKDIIKEDSQTERDLFQFLQNMGENPVIGPEKHTITFEKGKLTVKTNGEIHFLGNDSRSPTRYHNEREFRRGYNFIN